MSAAQDAARAYEAIIERFVGWAQTEDAIRGAVVIGSRARKDHPADEWADLDIVIWTSGLERYLEERSWVDKLGEPWITFSEPAPDPRLRELRVLFAGGWDVDFAFMAAAEHGGLDDLRDLADLAFGRGTRILLDRDGLVAGIVAAMRAPAPPRPPDAAALDEVVSDFWYHAVWTAKHLRRGELWWAKSACDIRLKHLLLVALEWDAAAAGRDPWFRGRFLEEWADQEVVGRLSSAFARYGEDDLWAALAVTMDLFSRVGRRLATRLGLAYPDRAEAHARELVERYGAKRHNSVQPE